MNNRLTQIIRHELRSLSEQKFKPTSSVCGNLKRPTKPEIFQALKTFDLRTVGDILELVETAIDSSPEVAGQFESMYQNLPKDVIDLDFSIKKNIQNLLQLIVQ